MTSDPVAILGGTGPEGKGLALRWARAGVPVVIGSRDAARAAEVAALGEALRYVGLEQLLDAVLVVVG